MSKFLLVFLLIVGVAVFAQTPVPKTPIAVSDPQAVALVTKSLLAMTGGTTVADVSLTASVTAIPGASDNQTVPGVFYAKGTDASLFTLTLPDGKRSELRRSDNGIPAFKSKIADAAAGNMAQHNAWTDAAWFFPALSALSQVSNPAYVFTYLGQEQKNGLNVEHLRSIHRIPFDTDANILTNLTVTDFYLDPISLLPLAIDFKQHPENDLKTDIPAEILFANYQSVNGIQVPFHIARLLNGTVILDITVTNAVVNLGLPDTQFSLQ